MPDDKNIGGVQPERKSTAPYRYFTDEEFNKLTPPCSISDMDVDFMRRLDYARHLAGFPFRLTSAFRSHKWNVEHGRNYHSFHEDGKAVDIVCSDGKQRAKMIWSLWMAGISGIGVYKTFVHADGRIEPTVFLGEL